ncbi:MAG: CapA family protein [Minisyncoccia bacterium]
MNQNPSFKIKHIFWIIVAITIGIFLASVALKTAGYEKIKQEDKNNLNENQVLKDTIPGTFYFIKDPTELPKVTAEAFFIGDLDNGEIILEKNKNQKFPIASVSKLMTATISLENLDQDSITQISAQTLATYGKNGNFYLGEKIKMGDLLYPLLLESSNDAAEAIARGSGRETFLQKMNEKAITLGMTSTSFEDPSGLSENNKSTTLDLFKLAKYIKDKEPILFKISTNPSFKNSKHVWFSINQFLHKDGYMGGKSGFIGEAKQTVISTFNLSVSKDESRNIAIVLLRSTDRYKDVESILKYINKNVYYGKEIDADADWVKQKEGVPDEVQNFATLMFTGDIMLDRGVKNSVMKNFDGYYSALFNNLGIFKKADIVFGNLEGPASDEGEDKHNLYSFRMDPSVIPALKGAGFSIVSVANNHVGDWGRVAYGDTLDLLKENEILYTGGGINSQEAEQPTIIEKYGMKIGYLGFSDVGPNWMGAKENLAGLLLTNNPRFDEIISNASKQVDYLVVSFHFGDEYQTVHNDRQEYLAHKAIDDGAKIIIGTHPHVVQDTENYKDGFIAYSLGNLIFDQYFSENTMQGMLLEIKLNKSGNMTIVKNIVKLNHAFQPETVVIGKEEKIKLQEAETKI